MPELEEVPAVWKGERCLSDPSAKKKKDNMSRKGKGDYCNEGGGHSSGQKERENWAGHWSGGEVHLICFIRKKDGTRKNRSEGIGKFPRKGLCMEKYALDRSALYNVIRKGR